MPVDAIGGVVNPQDATLTQNNTIDQEDFIKLFLAQLQFQDPLEPVDNREFLAQLAQFTALEQSRQTSQNTNDLLSMNATSQAIALLNRQVDVAGMGVPLSGTVIAVQFTTSGPQISVRDSEDQVITGVRLSQVTLVKP
ncbi:flagellar hook assembly protein FlgD [Marilutibacter alkalisoli]|uniref:Basal-body rod modification protein FlgD n=1 Tax=Marilutibacter alkalisoli TaxID=2591633 RepID=A0A514BRY2_9GAMM|nr:flagellar hook capping FlgD N-terminal domain-containing protein [Lysobacter alkalisoli]QDH70141.1 flagellar hook capping protein [Lysobacter alkalisoli]